MGKLIEINKISACYGDKVVLKDVSLDIFDNDFLGIIGPNGGGKTTLLKVILGLQPSSSGKITFMENDKPTPAIRIGYLPQLSDIDKKFPISVWEVVASGLAEQKPLFRSYSNEQKERIEQVLEQMGMSDLGKRPIGELSGGQLQRALLGRAIVSRPKLLILDEPNSYVDKRFESHLYQLLESINKESAIVLVSHDIGTVVSMVKNIACVNETLHYHSGTHLHEDWLTQAYNCPIDLVGHGDLPHRVLKKHKH